MSPPPPPLTPPPPSVPLRQTCTRTWFLHSWTLRECWWMGTNGGEWWGMVVNRYALGGCFPLHRFFLFLTPRFAEKVLAPFGKIGLFTLVWNTWIFHLALLCNPAQHHLTRRTAGSRCRMKTFWSCWSRARADLRVCPPPPFNIYARFLFFFFPDNLIYLIKSKMSDLVLQK